jgi:hypothetical protein
VEKIGDDASEKRVGSLETRSSTCRNLGPALGLFHLFTSPAIARDLGQWDNQPIAVWQWFQELMESDNPYHVAERRTHLKPIRLRSSAINKWQLLPTEKPSFRTGPEFQFQTRN